MNDDDLLSRLKDWVEKVETLIESLNSQIASLGPNVSAVLKDLSAVVKLADVTGNLPAPDPAVLRTLTTRAVELTGKADEIIGHVQAGLANATSVTELSKWLDTYNTMFQGRQLLDTAKADLERLQSQIDVVALFNHLTEVQKSSNGSELRKVMIPTLEALLKATPSPAAERTLERARVAAGQLPDALWDVLAGFIAPETIRSMAPRTSLSAAAGDFSDISDAATCKIVGDVLKWLGTVIPVTVKVGLDGDVKVVAGAEVGWAAGPLVKAVGWLGGGSGLGVTFDVLDLFGGFVSLLANFCQIVAAAKFRDAVISANTGSVS